MAYGIFRELTSKTSHDPVEREGSQETNSIAAQIGQEGEEASSRECRSTPGVTSVERSQS